MTDKSEAALAPGVNPMPGVQTYIMHPPGFDVALRLSIAPPVKPILPPSHIYPETVVYATDADFGFGTVVEAARIAIMGGAIAPATVVGIGYADETGDLDFTAKRRVKDFYRGSPRSMDSGPYGTFELGGADAFLAALKDHVIPAVERKISANTPLHRILLGTSAGGHFAAHALMTEPKLFQGVAMMSPMLIDLAPEGDGIDKARSGLGELVQDMEALASQAFPSGLRIFLSAGEFEEDPQDMSDHFTIISNALRMRSALARRGAVTALKQFEGENHGSVLGAAISRALRFLLPPGDAPG